MSLGITANVKKNGALLAYIANSIPNIHLRKLLKIVYLIDEKFMKMRNFPITWFDYYVWEKGPVAPEVYNIKNGAFGDYVLCHKNNKGSNIVEYVLSTKYQIQKQMDIFSPFELEVIDTVISENESKTPDELTSLTHEEGTLWFEMVKKHSVTFVDGKSDIEIPLYLLNGDDVDKNEIYEEAKWNMGFQAVLNQDNI